MQIREKHAYSQKKSCHISQSSSSSEEFSFISAPKEHTSNLSNNPGQQQQQQQQQAILPPLGHEIFIGPLLSRSSWCYNTGKLFRPLEGALTNAGPANYSLSSLPRISGQWLELADFLSRRSSRARNYFGGSMCAAIVSLRILNNAGPANCR